VRTKRPRALVSWSSGKDSAWALECVRRGGVFDVAGLLTTVTAGYARVSMHGVREEILDLQAARAGLPCFKVEIPPRCVNADYETAMGQALRQARARGVTHIVFGDLFLEDVRRYREERFAGTGIAPVFPLWGRNTRELAGEMILAGLRALLVCVDPRALSGSFAGRRFDARLLAELPEGVDPCGERGEFHTCVTAGPMFDAPLDLRSGAIVEREGFLFADLEIESADAATVTLETSR
jgi:uncharacterized protein (TIGR00290 family)